MIQGIGSGFGSNGSNGSRNGSSGSNGSGYGSNGSEPALFRKFFVPKAPNTKHNTFPLKHNISPEVTEVPEVETEVTEVTEVATEVTEVPEVKSEVLGSSGSSSM